MLCPLEEPEELLTLVKLEEVMDVRRGLQRQVRSGQEVVIEVRPVTVRLLEQQGFGLHLAVIAPAGLDGARVEKQPGLFRLVTLHLLAEAFCPPVDVQLEVVPPVIDHGPK